MSLEFSPDPGQESEARITALLLGEVTGAEAASLLEAIEADPQLAALYERLKKTVVLVREVSANPAQPVATLGANPAAPLKLSEERRQKLLAQFKTVKPKEFAPPPKKRTASPTRHLLELAAVLTIFVGLSGLLLPSFAKSKSKAAQMVILNHLRQLDGAKQEWALEHHAPPDAAPTFAQIQPYMGRGVSDSLPKPIAGEKYILGRMDQAPVAVVEGKKAKLYTLDGDDAAYKQQQVPVMKSGSESQSAMRARRADGAEVAISDERKPASPAPQQLAQNKQQQIYLPPADNNSATLTVTPSAHFGNNAKNVTMADGSVQQFSTSALRSGASGGASNVLVFPFDDTVVAGASDPTAGPASGNAFGRFRGMNGGRLQESGIAGGAGGGGAGNTATPFVSNANNFSFYRDVNGNGANAGKPEQASGFASSSQPHSPTNGSLGFNFYAGDPEWVGILTNSPRAQSSSNPFVGSYAFNTLPPGSNLNVDFIHNQSGVQNNSSVPIAAAQNNNVQLSFNTQPNPVVPPAATVAAPASPNSLADQLNEPQVVTESGKGVAGTSSFASRLNKIVSHAGSQQKDGVQLPTLGEVPSTGALFSNTNPSQAPIASDEGIERRLRERRDVELSSKTELASEQALQEEDKARKFTPSQHGAQLLTQHAEPAKRPQAITALPGIETTPAATPLPQQPSAPPLASASIPDQFGLKQEGDGRITSGLRPSRQGKLGIGNSAPAATPPATDSFNYKLSDLPPPPTVAAKGANHGLETDDLSLQNKNNWGYGNANPDKVKNFGRTNAVWASRADTFASTNFVAGKAVVQVDPETHGIIGMADTETLKQIQEKISKLDSSASNSGSSASTRQLARLYDTKKKELEDLQKYRDVLALQQFEEGVATNTAQLRTEEKSKSEMAELNLEIGEKQSQMAALNKRMGSVESLTLEQKVATPDVNDAPLPKPVVPPPVPQPEVFTSTNAFSTFSLNIADVSFKLAAASLEKGMMPDPASIRSEEFINAFDYRDPEAPPGVPIAFAWERARYPFAQNRDLLRFSLKTAATGRSPGRPLNIVLLLDNSGSMERADRVQIIHEALRVLAGQLQPQDTLSIVTFARTARLFVDGVPGNQAADVVEQVSGLTPQGGTNLEDAMKLAYETALRHYLANGINRVVLMTDGAANLGDVDPASLKRSVEMHRKQGIALDCFGIGWEGYNDDLLEVLARNGDGRYGFLNSPEEAANGFAHQLAGALNVAAEDVKVQVEFNPRRVTVYRQVGYAKLQLTKEQFRDNTVAAAQVGAAEAGNGLYVLQVDPNGDGPLATVRVRYKVPGTEDFQEHEWSVPFAGNALSLEQSSPAMRLAATASAFSEWLANSPYATEVTPDALLQDISGVPAIYSPDARPKQLEWMLRQAKSLTGK